MATSITKIVDPDNGAGTDYTSLSAWEAGEQKNLISADEIAVAECRCSAGSADTAYCYVDGWTTDIDHYIKIWTATDGGHRHPGKWDSTKYHMLAPASDGYKTLNVPSIHYTIIDGLQMDGNGGAAYGVVQINSSGGISNCIVRNSHGSLAYGIILRNSSTSSTVFHYLYNNLVYDITGIGSGILVSGGPIYKYVPVYNNTLYGCTTGITASHAKLRAVCKNNIVQHGDVNYSGPSFFLGTHNISDLEDAPNDVPINNATVVFADAPNADFHLSSADTVAKDAGVDLSSDSRIAFADDIDGDPRPYGAAWDIGADEIGFVPPPPPPPPRELLIVPEWEQAISIKRTWKTTIQQAITGKEKRSGLFTWPRKSMQYRTVALTSKEINGLKRKLYLDAAEAWDMPFWVDWVTLTAEAAQGASSLLVDDTRYKAFQIGKDCALVENYLSFEIIEILSFTQTGITLNATLEDTWPAGTKVYPAIKARIDKGHSKVSMDTDRAGRAKIAVTEGLE